MPETKRLTPKGQATRARIVASAADLIFQRGVAGTSIEDIRRAAGVSGSQMTHYFADKCELVRAVVAYRADALVANQTFDSFAALAAWTESVLASRLESGCAGGCGFGSLAGELAETDPRLRDELAAGYGRLEARLREGLEAMRERGDLRPDADPEALAHALLAANQGGLLLAQVKRDPAPLRAALSGALAYVRAFAQPTETSTRSG